MCSFIHGCKPSNFSTKLYESQSSLSDYPISSSPAIFFIRHLESVSISKFLRLGKLIILSMQLEESESRLHLESVFSTGASIFSIGGI